MFFFIASVCIALLRRILKATFLWTRMQTLGRQQPGHNSPEGWSGHRVSRWAVGLVALIHDEHSLARRIEQRHGACAWHDRGARSVRAGARCGEDYERAAGQLAPCWVLA
jgi:hypothetical protein